MKDGEPEKYIIVDPVTNCWIWQGYKNQDGYGRLRYNGRTIPAHHYFWEKKFGKILEPYPRNVLDHIVCDNPPCCNPDHLKRSTTGKNGSRYETEKTHCPRGHEYSGDNLIIGKYNKRFCRACQKIRNDKHNPIRNLIYR